MDWTQLSTNIHVLCTVCMQTTSDSPYTIYSLYTDK